MVEGKKSESYFFSLIRDSLFHFSHKTLVCMQHIIDYVSDIVRQRNCLQTSIANMVTFAEPQQWFFPWNKRNFFHWLFLLWVTSEILITPSSAFLQSALMNWTHVWVWTERTKIGVRYSFKPCRSPIRLTSELFGQNFWTQATFEAKFLKHGAVQEFE